MIRSSVSHVPVIDANFSSLPPDQTLTSILAFLETWLPLFRTAYLTTESSLLEDDISKGLRLYLQDKAKDLLFDFDAKKGVDFLIYIKPYVMSARPIFVIEAKRLPPTNNKDYVQGRTGGIERFKREQAGFVFDGNHCAMVAYMQQYDFDHWLDRINQWLTDLIASNDKYDEYDWEENDKLITITSNSAEIARYLSHHSRKTLPRLTINHFWLDMCVDNAT